MQAIIAKYLPPTNIRGARIKATCIVGSTVIPWDYSQSTVWNYDTAAIALIEKLGWESRGEWIGGEARNGYVYVCKPASEPKKGEGKP